jgi:hypothetical protein
MARDGASMDLMNIDDVDVRNNPKNTKYFDGALFISAPKFDIIYTTMISSIILT